MNYESELIKNKEKLDRLKESMSYRYTDVMIDLETLDTKPSAVVLSIGAVAFDLKDRGREQKEFYRGVCRSAQYKDGRTASYDTLVWWEQQSPEAISAAFTGDTYLIKAINDLISFIYVLCEPKTVRVWCKGLAMDIAIIRSLTDGVVLPWHYRNERDTRSYCMDKEVPETGLPTHMPVDDCRQQIMQVQAAYQWMKENVG